MQVNRRFLLNPFFVVVSDKMNYVDVIKYALVGSTIMLSIVFLIFITMFIYNNSLYFTISLLIRILILLFHLVSNLMLSSLTMIVLTIVYVGAMMILIGYVCAICPNLILTPSVSKYFVPTFFIRFIFMLTQRMRFLTHSQSVYTVFDYFYSFSGLFVFFIIVSILFLTLLIVTSQYLTPKGPFRSVNA